ncbi:uncharacterized protein PITG_23134 [Phytophthora infestans T30-4]|uniref:Uncharacterized protein n=1 Tax=Phytophthora infestans (strain T30-4) TaxID=403677 RepID=D0NZ95_PHYIT|nr:uncharacterized protein PITG_23134 [Phytophthora infestans T30-4]EEY68892.1 conserved hypothetical protein [Phytophthora infestans T30-4]|eukprot:XP_002997320.1 conserved hypothetical protein [Phytophthora infestans T30-4]
MAWCLNLSSASLATIAALIAFASRPMVHIWRLPVMTRRLSSGPSLKLQETIGVGTRSRRSAMWGAPFCRWATRVISRTCHGHLIPISLRLRQSTTVASFGTLKRATWPSDARTILNTCRVWLGIRSTSS